MVGWIGHLAALALLVSALSGCAIRYTRSTEICNQAAPPACTSVTDSAGLELEKK